MTSARQHRYVVYVPSDSKASSFVVTVPADGLVEDVVDEACRLRYGHALNTDEAICVYKCAVETVCPTDTVLNRVSVWLRQQKDADRLPLSDPLSMNFPNGPSPRETRMIDIVLFTQSLIERDEVLYALPDIHQSRMIQLHLEKASDAHEIRSPSEVINNPKYLRGCVERGDIHIHRPASNFGPHTSLFNPAFAKLKYRLERLDDPETWEPGLEPNFELLGNCQALILSSCNIFDNDDARRRDLVLNPFFDAVFQDVGVFRKSIEDGSAKPDAVWGIPPRVIREDKNEDGAGGNSTVQGSISYRKTISQKSLKRYLARTNCPAIIIGTMGTRIEISTAVYIGGVYMDKLISRELYIDAFQSRTILRLGRLCMALRHCYDELSSHYRFLSLNAELNTRHFYPVPLPVEGSDSVPSLEYLGKLTHGGQCLPVIHAGRDDKLAEDERPYAIYRAKMANADGERVDVVVKFTVRYNATAHRLLESAQLAPKLRYFAHLVSGHYMVVMDFIDYPPLSDKPKQENYLGICLRVGEAVKLLHERNLVFGDLRPQNIVLDPNNDMRPLLIDFDVCGTHGVDRYPASWNTRKHHPEVHRNGIMVKEHDIFLLYDLKKVLKEYSLETV